MNGAAGLWVLVGIGLVLLTLILAAIMNAHRYRRPFRRQDGPDLYKGDEHEGY